MAGPPPRAVLPSILLGTRQHSRELPLLHSLGIAGILIIGSLNEFSPAYSQSFTYHLLKLTSPSHLIASISEVSQIVNFITCDNEGIVLVCHDGDEEQAALILAMYAVDRYSWPFEQAWRHVNASNSLASLPRHLLSQGLEMEAICRARQTIKLQQNSAKMQLDSGKTSGRRGREDVDDYATDSCHNRQKRQV